MINQKANKAVFKHNQTKKIFQKLLQTFTNGINKMRIIIKKIKNLQKNNRFLLQLQRMMGVHRFYIKDSYLWLKKKNKKF